jgi:large subunit ribosomal protein L24
MAKYRIKRDDTVVVISGRHKGSVGRVLRLLPQRERVVVEGVNRVKRHMKPVGERPGAIVEKEAPIHISNVAYWDAENGRRVKVGYQVLDDGRKVRVDRQSGAVLDKA